MNLEEARAYCLARPVATEDFPFDETSLVIRVLGKMFALLHLEKPDTIALKCDPEYALELRERYPDAIQGAYHFNKKYWNQVRLDASVDDGLIRELIDHSYQEVLKKFTKKMRQEYELHL